MVKKGNAISGGNIKTGVVFTGEYLIGSGSDAARLLPVEIEKPDEYKLKMFQDKPLILSTFYFYFIRWYVEHYAEIVDVISEWRSAYQKFDLGLAPRLKETLLLFNSTYALLMQYGFQIGSLSEVNVKKSARNFLKMLTMLVKNQNQRVKMTSENVPEKKNYWIEVRELYKSKQFIIAKNSALFQKEIHDGVIHRNKLYLRGESFSKYFPNDNYEDVIQELVLQGVIEIGKTTYTKQISALKGLRFYVIPLTVIEN